MHLGSQLHAPHKLAGADSRMRESNGAYFKVFEPPCALHVVRNKIRTGVPGLSLL